MAMAARRVQMDKKNGWRAHRMRACADCGARVRARVRVRAALTNTCSCGVIDIKYDQIVLDTI